MLLEGLCILCLTAGLIAVSASLIVESWRIVLEIMGGSLFASGLVIGAGLFLLH